MTKEEDLSRFVDRSNWPYIGVYIIDEDVDLIAKRLSVAYEESLPVFIRYSDWNDKAQNVQKIVTFMTNIGYVLAFSSIINRKPVPDWLMCIKLVDYKKNINMDQWGLWSRFSTTYYERKLSSGEIAKGDNKRNFDYEFPDIHTIVAWTVKEMK